MNLKDEENSKMKITLQRDGLKPHCLKKRRR